METPRFLCDILRLLLYRYESLDAYSLLTAAEAPLGTALRLVSDALLAPLAGSATLEGVMDEARSLTPRLLDVGGESRFPRRPLREGWLAVAARADVPPLTLPSRVMPRSATRPAAGAEDGPRRVRAVAAAPTAWPPVTVGEGEALDAAIARPVRGAPGIEPYV